MSRVLSKIRQISGLKSVAATPQLILAQLMALGYAFDEVYPFIAPKSRGANYTIDKLNAAEKALHLTPWFDSTVEKLREDMNILSTEDAQAQMDVAKYGIQSDTEDGDGFDYTKKEDIITALSEEAKNLRGKERVDALIKLADLQRMKNEESKEEKRHVMHYLPQRCASCPCWEKTRDIFPDLKPLDY